MAIFCKRVSKSIEPTLRIKERDYTIPIRLNQRPLPPHPQPNNQVPAASLREAKVSRLEDSPREANGVYQKLEDHFNIKVNKIIHPMISMRATRRRFAPSSSSVVLVLVACCATSLTINTEICHCDTKTSLHSPASSPSSSSSSPSSSSVTSVGYNSNSLTSHKENLLSALSDNIERQHFKIKPARALIQQRPSKFDSADYLSDLNLGAGLDFIKKKAQPLVSIKKVDDSMKQILQMHEHAATAASSASQIHPVVGRHHPSSKAMAKPSSSLPLAPMMPEKSSLVAVKRWRKLTSSPNLVSSLNHGKVVSKALAYVMPLMSSKLMAPSSDSTNLGQSFTVKNSTNNDINGLPKLRLHPFAGRSSKQVSSFGKSLISPFRPYGATTSPQTSSPVRPLGFNDRGATNQYATPLNTFKDSSSLKSGKGVGGGDSGSNSVDSIISDLMADSSDSSIGASIEAASAGISSHFGTSSSSSLFDKSANGGSKQVVAIDGPTPETQVGLITAPANSMPKKPQPHKSSVGSRLKKGANKLAQNYFQNLITLSQLPILSTTNSMTSTAPSILEKKRKPNKIDKIGGSGGTESGSGGSTFRRRRLIEDLYRYAYMLGTGVRNKRDPLEALGSSPNPSIIHSSSSSSLTSHKKSVLSQRSINKLVALNNNEMLNYVRKLRSMLTMGPMSKAKPRGVMWDMATDPSLAVTVFHLLERASVALPLGFLLLPIVQMIRHPLNGINLGRILPAKASHRSVDIEELAKRLDVVDKMLSRALRSTHRESNIGK